MRARSACGPASTFVHEVPFFFLSSSKISFIIHSPPLPPVAPCPWNVVISSLTRSPPSEILFLDPIFLLCHALSRASGFSRKGTPLFPLLLPGVKLPFYFRANIEAFNVFPIPLLLPPPRTMPESILSRFHTSVRSC